MATESDLGIPFDASGRAAGPAAHRLVTIGDSLTMGFKSLAITDTHLSWTVMVAETLGFVLPRAVGLPLTLRTSHFPDPPAPTLQPQTKIDLTRDFDGSGAPLAGR